MFRKFIISFLFMGLIGQTVSMAQDDQTPQIIGQDKNSNPIITAVPFLTIAPDARSAGMGDAGVALSPDANAAYWNPSKLAFAKQRMGFSLSYTPWLQKIVGDMSLAYLSGYRKLNENQVIGGSLRYFNLGSMEFTNTSGSTIADFNPREFAFDLTFAMKLSERLSIGGTGRFIHSNLTGNISSGATTNDTKPGNTAAVDLSMYYNNEDVMFLGYPTNVAFGVNLSNIGFKITYTDENQKDFIPTNLRLGTAITTHFDPMNKLTWAFDVNKLLVPTPPHYDENRNIIAGKDPDRSMISGMFGSFGDAPDGFSEEMKELIFATGLEYWYNDLFAVRGGYFHENKTKGNRQYFTFGLGLRYQKFGIDFAYLAASQRNHPLEDTLRFTLMVNFGESKDIADQPGEI
ncbi:type IX secretion system outer membrane channel protein PorV [Rapidithrix thailandica]|uniref:Type IX secretion system outer membrane channel protein PorV n=1 Tax=Rapidithrix thailandica TaxID=413964 RepID=A0AAW9SG28_9BACT